MAWSPAVSGSVWIAAGLLMFGLAAWMLAIDARRPVHRAFSVWLVVRGMTNGLVGAAVFLPASADYLGGVWGYFAIGLTFSTVAFLLAYERRGWVAQALVVAGWAACAALYARDHGVLFSGDFLSWGTWRHGPLYALAPLLFVVYGWGAWIFAREFAATEGSRRRSAWLLAFAFALLPVANVVGTLALLVVGAAPAGFWPALFNALYLAAAVPVAFAGARILRADPAAARRYAVALLPAAVLGAWTGLAYGLSLAAGDFATQLVDAVLTLAFPAVAVYALLRHRLFDLDVRVKWTVSRGTLAAVFLGVFVVATQAAQELLNDTYGVLVGGVTAGLLFFAISPIQAFAERVASVVVPGAKPLGEMDGAERAAFYRDAVRLAWSDGSLTADERRLLEHARERLGLSLEEAARIEREAAPA